MRAFLFSVIVISNLCLGFSQTNKAKELVGKLTLEEKVNLVVGMGMKLPGLPQGTGVGMIEDKVAGAAGTTYSIEKYGLATTVVADGPAGLRIDAKRKDDNKTYYATAWPVATLLASSWDTKLVQEVGKAMGNEIKEYGVDVILGPGMNIHRNPLGGRNFEYYSEDPLVSGKIAAAIVNGIQSNGVGTSIKHFAINNQEKNRNTVDVILSERAMREIYLRGFEIAVKEANPWTVMSSYNKINGPYASEAYDLLTTILRKEWGFKGMVMTDWFGGKDAVAQMKAGNDLLMPGTPDQKKAITDAINNGKLNITALNDNVERIINYVMKTPSYKKLPFSNKPDLKSHAKIARTAAADGMILLKNKDGVLPLSNKNTIAVFGNTSYDFISGGTGSGDVNEEYTISLVNGMKMAGFNLLEDLAIPYNSYLTEEKAKQPKKNFFEEFMNPTPRITELNLKNNTIEASAQKSGAAIITIGRNAGEGSDRKVENDFNLKAEEVALIDQVSKAFHAQKKKVIVIINAGGVIEVKSWQDKVDAVLLSWQPGLEAGNAVTDVISGKVNPSGKLATTFPAKYADEVTGKNFPGIEFPEKKEAGMFGMPMIPAEVIYEEGIYVGYRYYNTFKVKPAYEFGYGLSYTSFQYSNIKLSSDKFNDKITVSVDIKNAGKLPGKEVVQLYVAAPTGKLNKPESELRAFDKTKVLNPGEKITMKFTLNAKDLASFDTESTSWIAAAGKYNIKVGASSLNILQSKTFDLAKDIIVEKCNKVLGPHNAISELKH